MADQGPPKKRRSPAFAQRYCIDCGIPVKGKAKRCTPCKDKFKFDNKSKKWSERNKQGFCGTCDNPPAPGSRFCFFCLKRQRRAQERSTRKKLDAGICPVCGKNPRVGKSRCLECAARASAKAKQIKREALDHYGGVCTCCGEWRIDCLTLDHVNNDGTAHRKKNGQPKISNLYKWARAHGYPPGLETRCFSCNCGREIAGGGPCPHQLFPDPVLHVDLRDLV